MSKYSKIGVLLLFLCSATVFYGQNRPGKERIKTLKVAFITERLGLTSQEAQVFWPLYNEHEEKKAALNQKERREIRSKLVDFEGLSENEANKLLSQLIALEQEKHRLNVEYLRKISEAVSPKKTFLLIKAEEDFNRRLLKRIQERRMNRN
ncbi:hypothetical protein [Poritiphilus flavus]|uniref:Periplasmic heavy metal sensor n=1 Tax=Poritiphilus flavus TaxID=2697053 RepID=A0A6L9EAT4_9FLAO|nr:hypothetical protein [Poritiphilus flavus]NAS11668.1 hypothetical protein [Poritiphilus flavus]